jgi:hypothetical protein
MSIKNNVKEIPLELEEKTKINEKLINSSLDPSKKIVPNKDKFCKYCSQLNKLGSDYCFSCKVVKSCKTCGQINSSKDDNCYTCKYNQKNENNCLQYTLENKKETFQKVNGASSYKKCQECSISFILANQEICDKCNQRKSELCSSCGKKQVFYSFLCWTCFKEKERTSNNPFTNYNPRSNSITTQSITRSDLSNFQDTSNNKNNNFICKTAKQNLPNPQPSPINNAGSKVNSFNIMTIGQKKPEIMDKHKINANTPINKTKQNIFSVKKPNAISTGSKSNTISEGHNNFRMNQRISGNGIYPFNPNTTGKASDKKYTNEKK